VIQIICVFLLHLFVLFCSRAVKLFCSWSLKTEEDIRWFLFILLPTNLGGLPLYLTWIISFICSHMASSCCCLQFLDAYVTNVFGFHVSWHVNSFVPLTFCSQHVSPRVWTFNPVKINNSGEDGRIEKRKRYLTVFPCVIFAVVCFHNFSGQCLNCREGGVEGVEHPHSWQPPDILSDFVLGTGVSICYINTIDISFGWILTVEKFNRSANFFYNLNTVTGQNV